ncbi:ribosomal RNA-processing protein 8 [Polyodon spathula]|uniref:ribosomal RNA-processing protein 8 n=1 Tax=Polyodon spathula TaxID=7913 RepID=UPI001B7D9D5C|nr:ribosomal RNA-processing protein 8 [Polyodon spathula]
MFADEEWNDDFTAQMLTQTMSQQDGKLRTKMTSVPKEGLARKKSLLRTLQALGSVLDWNTAPGLGSADSEAEETPQTATKKRRRKKVCKHAGSAEQGCSSDNLQEKEGAGGSVERKQKKIKSNGKTGQQAGEKRLLETIDKDRCSIIEDLQPFKKQEKKSEEIRLHRKQWKNKLKNKRKNKNKYKQNGQISQTPAATRSTDTLVSYKHSNEGETSNKLLDLESRNGQQNKCLGQNKNQKEVYTGKRDFNVKEKNSRHSTVKKATDKGMILKGKTVEPQIQQVENWDSNRTKAATEKPQIHAKTVTDCVEEKTSSYRKKQVINRQREKLRQVLGSQATESDMRPLEQEEAEGTGIDKSQACAEEEKSPPAPLPDRSAALRARMEQRLESARFRYINEQLYTSSSQEACKLFHEDHTSFEIYHRGFTAQVARWPHNPVDSIISYIRSKPPSLVVADFGCGDCKIARSVKNKVYSFDLAPVNNLVTVSDMANVPLPDGSVDIAVFCLSLMGTNLYDFLVEANRVLVARGLLKIAEVASRFENVRNFISALASLGFKLVSKDTENSHFYTFEFIKAGSPRGTGRQTGLDLKPCVYKKR